MGAGSPKSSLSCLDRVQRRMRWLIGDNLFKTLQPLSHRRNVASLSLLYRYYSGKCSEELHQLVPPPKAFGKDTRLAVHTRQNHPHALDAPDSMICFHADSFFPRTVKLWNSLSSGCFPLSYNIDKFKKRVNQHLALSLSFLSLFPLPLSRHFTHFSRKTLKLFFFSIYFFLNS